MNEYVHWLTTWIHNGILEQAIYIIYIISKLNTNILFI